MIEIDFETDAIEPRPKYPPRPVGVAVGWRGQGGRRYLGWGHPIGNNATKVEATKLLRAAYRSGEPLVFHNAAFDLDVAETHLGLKPPPWDRVHDTMFLAFLYDPFAASLSLKPLADQLLDLPPDEADELKEWIVANVKNPDGSKIKPSRWGAHIAKAPGGLVGKYAVGDIKRTGMLFKFLYEKIREARMLGAYDRERRFLPVKMAMDRRGVAVATDRLRRDLRMWETALARIDDWIGQRLGVPGLEIDKNIHLADALDSAGVVDEWELTPTGKRSTAKEAIKRCLKDQEVLSALSYRGRLATSVRNFGRPWLRVADGDGAGRIFCEWNQVRQANERGSGIVGARTGRISSTPNLMNVPKRPDLLAFSETMRRRFAKIAREQEVSILHLPADFRKFACALPNLRDYLKPEKGRRLLIRDYCFSADTEVLTEDGWVQWPDYDGTRKLAQWSGCGVVTYADPIEVQTVRYSGPMFNIVGDRSTDLLVSPNHRCMVELENGDIEFVPPDEYPFGHANQYHAGVRPSSIRTSSAVIVLTAAIQADAKVLPNKIVFNLKKKRKIDRLVESLGALSIKFVARPHKQKIGFVELHIARSEVNDLIAPYLCFGDDTRSWVGKTFTRAWVNVHHEDRLKFLEELSLWDGSWYSDTSWYYATTNARNADLIHELCAITGLRGNLRITSTKKGRPFYTINIRRKAKTGTDTFRRQTVQYSGVIYCATTPAGTLIVRRNGRIAVTGNSQQELRILGHFEGGPLLRAYLADPWLDVHALAQRLINELLMLDLPRGPVKTTGFGLIYGMGASLLAQKTGQPLEQAKRVKRAYLDIFPGLADLIRELKRRARRGEPYSTWGDRVYHCERPIEINGEQRQLDYKMLNYLIQGSAADNTKEAAIRYHDAAVDGWLEILVHDEFIVSADAGGSLAEMARLRDAMESVEFDVPMLSTGKIAAVSWARAKAFDDRRGSL